MVFNVTKEEDIRVRTAAVDPGIWPSDPARPKQRDPSAGDTFYEFTKSGKELMPDLINQIYRTFNERNDTDIPVPK